MDKQYILDHVDDFNAEQLFKFISDGLVTLIELRKTGLLDISKIREINRFAYREEKNFNELKETKIRGDNNFWDNVRNTEQGCRDYLTNFPEGLHVDEAREKIDDYEEQQRINRIVNQDLLDNIKQNPNSFSPAQILNFLNNGNITEDDLVSYCNIPQTVIGNLGNIKIPKLTLGDTPDFIPPGYTEVYFWGGIGSGKTCALGAILQMAEKRGYLKIAMGPGYNYAYQLKNIFSEDNVANDYLPAPSPVEVTQYLPFTLKKENEKISRSVSLIELSGEIFKCFFDYNAGNQLPTELHLRTFNSLRYFLGSKNRKIHFFFIDYDTENKPDENGLKQCDYLDAASTYFKNNSVFENTTTAIYVILTKSDLMTDENGNKIPVHQRVEAAKNYLNTNNYKAFINTLKEDCKRYNINSGKLTVEPFSLGNVYFRKICDFDGSSADNIVDIMMERISPDKKKSIFDIFS